LSRGASPIAPEILARLLAVVRANPELTIGQLSNRFGLSACSIRGRLREAGLYVKRDGYGNLLDGSPDE
jgi:hypothetical protein